MIIARLHRGGLAESMKTAKTFNSIDEMKQWFAEQHENAFEVIDVVIDGEKIFDSRNGWNTQYVCTKKYGDKKYSIPQCIGMCDLNYNH